MSLSLDPFFLFGASISTPQGAKYLCRLPRTDNFLLPPPSTPRKGKFKPFLKTSKSKRAAESIFPPCPASVGEKEREKKRSLPQPQQENCPDFSCEKDLLLFLARLEGAVKEQLSSTIIYYSYAFSRKNRYFKR